MSKTFISLNDFISKVDKKPAEVTSQVVAEVVPVPVKQTAQERQDNYGAPAVDTYGAPSAQQDYSAPAQDSYGSPQAPSQDTYGSPKAPAQDTYGSPQAPAYTPQAQPSEGGTQGYYYYYYPVSTSPVQSALPQYAPPRQGSVGGSNPLSNIGIPIIVAIVVGIGIIIGIGILVASTTTTTTTTGRQDDTKYNHIKYYLSLGLPWYN